MEGLKRRCMFGTGFEEERARFEAAQSFVKVTRAAASARECTMATKMAVPPSLKVVNWIFTDGNPWYSFESWRANLVSLSRSLV